jgi:glutamyl-tRNA synthetase
VTEKPTRVRFAPSPTGHMHLGSARTALYNYLLAKKTGGKFILRIEDTDQKRYFPGAEQELIDGLHWLGLDYDEGPDIGGPFGPYRQTDRKSIYDEHIQILIGKGKAYPCFCSPERLTSVREEQMKNKEQPHYDGMCRSLDPVEARRRVEAGEKHVVRFKMEKEGKTVVSDLLRGEIILDNHVLDDSVLIKSDGWPTYHFAAMVDDHTMEITHVFRGSEWLGTFPLHANIIRAFGWEEPIWIHLSIFLKPSGKGKMSKRETAEALKDGYSIFVKDMTELGFIPEGLNNWTALMGWGAGETEDVLTMNEMIEKFDIRKLNASPAAINFNKLDYFNGEHIRRLSIEDLAARVKPYFLNEGLVVDEQKLIKIIPIIRERLVTLDDCLPFAAWFFKDTVDFTKEDLIAKNMTAAETYAMGVEILDIMESLPELSHSVAEEPLRNFVEKKQLAPNQVFGFLRIAVSGQKVSPPLFESMEIVGKKIVLERVKQALSVLKEDY